MTGYEPRNAREREACEQALRELLAVDATQPRPRLVDRVRGDPAPRAARFLTLAAEYSARRTFARDMARPPANVFPAWARGTVRRAYVPQIPMPGYASTRDYVRTYDRLNNLRHADQ